MIYETLAAGYDKMLAPFERRFLARWRRETLAELPSDAEILEIGAGTGLNFPHYPDVARAVASDFSSAMLDRSRSRVTCQHLVRADAQTLPFPENSFDAAFATLVFCSIAEPLRAFEELIRVVRPNGRVVLLEHVRPEGALGHAFDVFNVFSTAIIDDCFNRKTASLASESGLDVVEVRRKALGAVNLIVCRVC